MNKPNHKYFQKVLAPDYEQEKDLFFYTLYPYELMGTIALFFHDDKKLAEFTRELVLDLLSGKLKEAVNPYARQLMVFSLAKTEEARANGSKGGMKSKRKENQETENISNLIELDKAVKVIDSF